MIDKAFIDRAEELGIKDLLIAFAESLASAKTAAAVHRVQSSDYGYLITTLRSSTCTCGDLLSPHRSSIVGSMPERPHAPSCAWSRFMVLFGDEKTKTEFDRAAMTFRAWAKRVCASPDNEPYRNVVLARDFLDTEQDKEKKR